MNIDIIETIRTKYSGLYVSFSYYGQKGFFNVSDNGEVIAYGGDVWITSTSCPAWAIAAIGSTEREAGARPALCCITPREFDLRGE